MRKTTLLSAKETLGQNLFVSNIYLVTRIDAKLPLAIQLLIYDLLFIKTEWTTIHSNCIT